MSENHTRSVLSHTVRGVGGTTVVTLCGEIDLATAVPLSALLDALTYDPHPDLVLDLRSVSFVDCAGLTTLCRTQNRVRARNGRLRLLTDSSVHLRVLRAAGLGGVFEVHSVLGDAPDRTSATAAVG
ncbi:STAS domain-containing protein [Streptomyces sp. NPDC005483]|uniref:STAS domain-containing protein n=1 Tax=Streptomyces sp. NPDC005483 TaxID=3154882 RepID=UPI0033ACC05A